LFCYFYIHPLWARPKQSSRSERDKRHRQQNEKAPFSYIAIGSDGVLRSLNIDNEVIVAVGLPPHLIKAFIDRYPYNEKLEARFQNSDGTLIPQEQWWAPDPSILPQVYTAERKEEASREYEEKKDII
jgi:hypothetical protein